MIDGKLLLFVIVLCCRLFDLLWIMKLIVDIIIYFVLMLFIFLGVCFVWMGSFLFCILFLGIRYIEFRMVWLVGKFWWNCKILWFGIGYKGYFLVIVMLRINLRKIIYVDRYSYISRVIIVLIDL